MTPIRTKKGKLFGEIDNYNEYIYIKDGKNIRLIKIPDEGLTLQYISNNKPPETILIHGKVLINQ